MGLRIEDEGSTTENTEFLQGTPCKSRKRDRTKVESGQSQQWRGIPRAVQGVLLIETCPARVHRAEDARAQQAGQEDESDHHGKGLKYVRTCQVVQDVLD